MFKSIFFGMAFVVLVWPQSTSHAQTGKSTDKDDKSEAVATAVVVVEGVGSTEENALKNAFRNAVRQVVGAVVDTETLIKNDAIIDDSVLTYSAGLVKKYEEVPGSKSGKTGSHRIRIKAVVERSDVVQKLKAANVSMMSVDGKSLFSEVASQLQSAETSFLGWDRASKRLVLVGSGLTP